MRWLLLVSLLPACYDPLTSPTMSTDRAVNLMKLLSIEQTRCTQVKIVDEQVATDGTPDRWTAAGCGRVFRCERASKVTSCVETEESRRITIRRLVIDRLALELGCSKQQVSIVQEADWSFAGEQALRLTAPGGPYICSVAPGRRVECRAPLGSSLPSKAK